MSTIENGHFAPPPLQEEVTIAGDDRTDATTEGIILPPVLMALKPPAQTIGEEVGTEVGGESGDDSDEEWNYVSGKENRQPTQEQKLSAEDMESQLNPNAAEFVPVLDLDSDIAHSPTKQSELKDLTKVKIPSASSFLKEISKRPSELNDFDDLEKSLNGTLNNTSTKAVFGDDSQFLNATEDSNQYQNESFKDTNPFASSQVPNFVQDHFSEEIQTSDNFKGDGFLFGNDNMNGLKHDSPLLCESPEPGLQNGGDKDSSSPEPEVCSPAEQAEHVVQLHHHSDEKVSSDHGPETCVDSESEDDVLVSPSKKANDVDFEEKFTQQMVDKALKPDLRNSDDHLNIDSNVDDLIEVHDLDERKENELHVAHVDDDEISNESLIENEEQDLVQVSYEASPMNAEQVIIDRSPNPVDEVCEKQEVYEDKMFSVKEEPLFNYDAPCNEHELKLQNGFEIHASEEHHDIQDVSSKISTDEKLDANGLGEFDFCPFERKDISASETRDQRVEEPQISEEHELPILSEDSVQVCPSAPEEASELICPDESKQQLESEDVCSFKPFDSKSDVFVEQHFIAQEPDLISTLNNIEEENETCALQSKESGELKSHQEDFGLLETQEVEKEIPEAFPEFVGETIKESKLGISFDPPHLDRIEPISTPDILQKLDNEIISSDKTSNSFADVDDTIFPTTKTETEVVALEVDDGILSSSTVKETAPLDDDFVCIKNEEPLENEMSSSMIDHGEEKSLPEFQSNEVNVVQDIPFEVQEKTEADTESDSGFEIINASEASTIEMEMKVQSEKEAGAIDEKLLLDKDEAENNDSEKVDIIDIPTVNEIPTVNDILTTNEIPTTNEISTISENKEEEAPIEPPATPPATPAVGVELDNKETLLVAALAAAGAATVVSGVAAMVEPTAGDLKKEVSPKKAEPGVTSKTAAPKSPVKSTTAKPTTTSKPGAAKPAAASAKPAAASAKPTAASAKPISASKPAAASTKTTAAPKPAAAKPSAATKPLPASKTTLAPTKTAPKPSSPATKSALAPGRPGSASSKPSTPTRPTNSVASKPTSKPTTPTSTKPPLSSAAAAKPKPSAAAPPKPTAASTKPPATKPLTSTVTKKPSTPPVSSSAKPATKPAGTTTKPSVTAAAKAPATKPTGASAPKPPAAAKPLAAKAPASKPAPAPGSRPSSAKSTVASKNVSSTTSTKAPTKPATNATKPVPAKAAPPAPLNKKPAAPTAIKKPAAPTDKNTKEANNKLASAKSASKKAEDQKKELFKKEEIIEALEPLTQDPIVTTSNGHISLIENGISSPEIMAEN